jgi:hypothetical protein
VTERQIWDNIILVQEAIHTSVTNKEKGMIIKIDMENAFDRVKHEFLYEVLSKFGFQSSFISWIKACISSPWITPLINGPNNVLPSLKRSQTRLPSFSDVVYNHGRNFK